MECSVRAACIRHGSRQIIHQSADVAACAKRKDKKITLEEWSTRVRKLGFLGPEEVVNAVFQFMDDDESGFVTPKEFQQLQVHRSFRNAITGSNLALRLILMRHPEADYSEGAYANGDEERQLTPQGTAQAVRMARLVSLLVAAHRHPLSWKYPEAFNAIASAIVWRETPFREMMFGQRRIRRTYD